MAWGSCLNELKQLLSLPVPSGRRWLWAMAAHVWEQTKLQSRRVLLMSSIGKLRPFLSGILFPRSFCHDHNTNPNCGLLSKQERWPGTIYPSFTRGILWLLWLCSRKKRIRHDKKGRSVKEKAPMWVGCRILFLQSCKNVVIAQCLHTSFPEILLYLRLWWGRVTEPASQRDALHV